MNKELLDPGYLPDHWLVLLLLDGQPRFIGLATQAEADKIVADQSGQAVRVEYIVSVSSGNTRCATLAEAMKTKAQCKKSAKNHEQIIGIQPVIPPKDLNPQLASVWWEAPRENDFPDFPVN